MKKVLVTGGSRGLGAAICERLDDGPYQVDEISRSSGVDLRYKIPDFDCDILILNAGVWENDWRVNYEAPREMAEKMPKEKLVIFILSNAAYQSFGNDDYTASKSGLLHYVRRKQGAGFAFASIAPGTIDTDFWAKAEVDNRKKGCMKPKVVAEMVYQIIKAWEAGALVKELMITPC